MFWRFCFFCKKNVNFWKIMKIILKKWKMEKKPQQLFQKSWRKSKIQISLALFFIFIIILDPFSEQRFWRTRMFTLRPNKTTTKIAVFPVSQPTLVFFIKISTLKFSFVIVVIWNHIHCSKLSGYLFSSNIIVLNSTANAAWCSCCCCYLTSCIWALDHDITPTPLSR